MRAQTLPRLDVMVSASWAFAMHDTNMLYIWWGDLDTAEGVQTFKHLYELLQTIVRSLRCFEYVDA